MRQTRALAFLILTLAACQTVSEPESTPTRSDTPIVISEVLAGVDGNNNLEFIELFNTSDDIEDLNGLSLWYRLPSSDADLFVYQWASESLIPGRGHYLLTRRNQDFELTPNATFTQALNTTAGGLLLRDSEGRVVDALGWGNAPREFTEQSPAPKLENGHSLERHPGGASGNTQDGDDNSKDFFLSPDPSPQNTGSTPTPSEGQALELSISGPTSVEPGSEFHMTLSLVNVSDEDIDDLTVEMALPSDLLPTDIPASFEQIENKLYWRVEDLPAGIERSETLLLQAPWAYLNFIFDNVYASGNDGSIVAFASPLQARIEGGIIPIGTARNLLGAELTVEGIATMYTGGYYAGGGNVKFYIEDQSGGVQVQVFGGEGQVRVPIGARVRVKGEMGVYRDSIQIVPNSVPADIEILDPSTDQPTPLSLVPLRQAANDTESLPGRLVQVEGTVSRVEEFTYSYEMDLVDDEGQTLRLYIDKLTEMSVETIEVGRRFRARGIIDMRDGNILLYPRVQSDLEEIFPPVLMVEVIAPNTVLAGESFEVILNVTNHSEDSAQEMILSSPLPSELAQLEAIYNDGSTEGDEILWLIPELSGGGSSTQVGYKLKALGETGQIIIDTAIDNPDDVPVVEPEPWQIFIGTTVPIWAIQGDGFGSPYVLDQVTTSGVVTGIFPELGGFWVQSTNPDLHPSTSEGLFIHIGERESDLRSGDYIEVTGDVREISQQTMLEVRSLDDIHVIQRGQPLPDPIDIWPPIENEQSLSYYEALEGMLVQVSAPSIAVSPTSRYGEYSLVLRELDIDRIWRGQPSGHIIMVDDGTFDVHEDSSTLDYTIKTGDQVSELYGPLAFTFGQYKIEPLHPPEVVETTVTVGVLPPLEEDEFSLMTWNVENLFDILAPHPSNPPLPRKAEYELSLTKIANTILAAGTPTIVGLQEVEHLGILEDLSDHTLIKEYGYIPALIEGTDSRGIDVGYLVRGDRAELTYIEQFVAPEGLTSRPPLLIQVQLQSPNGSIALFVINNHFTSLAGGVQATEPRRSAQAAWNVTILEEILADSPDALIAVLGDLNSFLESKPIRLLQEAGLVHVFDVLDPNQRYTYIFEGTSQTLDHILVTPDLMAWIDRVDILHLNADFPPPDPDDPSPIHTSDHDPVIARFRFPKD